MIKDYTQTWGVSGLEKNVSDLIINGESDCFKAGKRS